MLILGNCAVAKRMYTSNRHVNWKDTYYKSFSRNSLAYVHLRNESLNFNPEIKSSYDERIGTYRAEQNKTKSEPTTYNKKREGSTKGMFL